MASHTAHRDYGRIDDIELLEWCSLCEPLRLGYHLPLYHRVYQLLRRARIRRSRVRLLTSQGRCHSGLHVCGTTPIIATLCSLLISTSHSIFCLVIDVGGGPTHHYYGAHTWDNPGAFANGFKGVCSVFVTAAFSFGGTELVGLAAAETENPRLALPTAIKQVFWRICLVSLPFLQYEAVVRKFH
jgi:hypothetical protein